MKWLVICLALNQCHTGWTAEVRAEYLTQAECVAETERLKQSHIDFNKKYKNSPSHFICMQAIP